MARRIHPGAGSSKLRPSFFPSYPVKPLPPSRELALLLTLAGIQFTHIVDFMVMMPLGPQFTRLFAITDSQFGLLVSAYTLAAGAAGLVGCTFVDRYERKRLLLTLYGGFILATLACALAPTYELLMAARVLAGMFGGVLSALVQTIVGDAVPFERRGRAMGIIMSAFSLATVAGVPGSLWLADHLGWQSTFAGIALVSVGVGALGLYALPRLDAHLLARQSGAAPSPWRALGDVVREPNHWRAFALSALVMAGGFTAIPYLTIYLTINVGVDMSQIPLIYFAGGIATIFSARAIGVLADRWGKVRTFRLVAAACTLPVLAVTHMGQTPFVLVLVVTTAFFVLMSGRMIPGMALITSAATPALRGSFMSLNGSIQAAAMGIASLVGGLLIGRGSDGLVHGYAFAGWISTALAALSIWWVGRLRVAPAPKAAPAAAAA